MNDDYLDRIGYEQPVEEEKIHLPRWAYSDEYLEKCGIDRCTTISELKDKMVWGTYGKNREYYPFYRWVRLRDASFNHLGNILKTQTQIHSIQRQVIKELWEEKTPF